MTFHFIFKYTHALIGILLIFSILVQNRSSGLGSSLGGSGVVRVTRRGAEKVLFRSTIILAVLFVLMSLGFVFVR